MPSLWLSKAIKDWGWGKPLWFVPDSHVSDKQMLSKVWNAELKMNKQLQSHHGDPIEKIVTSDYLVRKPIPLLSWVGRRLLAKGKRKDIIEWQWYDKAHRTVGGKYRMIGKVGFKVRPAPIDRRMSMVASKLFGERRKIFKVGMLVYMVVEPEYRGAGWGDVIVQATAGEMRRRGLDYMLLIVDDDGTGRLFRYVC